MSNLLQIWGTIPTGKKACFEKPIVATAARLCQHKLVGLLVVWVVDVELCQAAISFLRGFEAQCLSQYPKYLQMLASEWQMTDVWKLSSKLET